MDPRWTLLDARVACLAQPRRFPSPFDELGPDPLARHAAQMLQAEFASGLVADGIPASALEAPGGGKMFGVLVARAADGGLGFLRAFSGTIAGRFDVPGYVPPIFDREARDAVELDGERTVKRLTARAEAFAASTEVADARAAAAAVSARHHEEFAAMRRRHAANRQQRRARRAQLQACCADDCAHRQELHELAQQSRRDKAERRRLEQAHAIERAAVGSDSIRLQRLAAAHARLHRMVSRRLMRRIHDTYRVANARGEGRPLRSLYALAEPPGGSGDCAAPKLLAYAVAHGLQPVALAEFWWGAPPAGGGRVAGAFYPACRDKCGPLLPFMLEGLDVAPPRRFAPPRAVDLELPVVFEDRWIVVVDKPAGLLSVPARDETSGDSVLSRLKARYPDADGPLLVHRLDLDTSGLLVAARDGATHAALQRQFLRRTVRKRYVALVEGDPAADAGVIELPIRLDPNDRPRQIHDPVAGRSAVTEWEVIGRGAFTRVVLLPRSGRTHQLRVHAAHPLGLAAPIAGDRLYGHEGGRLMLHAEHLAFTHPATGERVAFESPAPF